jgi:hypothetical protein
MKSMCVEGVCVEGVCVGGEKHLAKLLLVSSVSSLVNITN